MNSLLTLALVVCCAASSWACCTPDQWEGVEGSQGGYAGYFKKGFVKENAYVSYDYTNKRSSVFLSFVKKDYENKFHIITRYDDEDCPKCGGRMYIVDMKKDKCWVKRARGAFRKACIPEDAKELGSFYMGLKGGFKVRAFEARKGSIYATVSVADLDDGICVPVGEILAGKLRRVDFMQSIGFVNLTPGIKNETVFDIPSQCDDAKEIDFSFAASVERDHFILAI